MTKRTDSGDPEGILAAAALQREEPMAADTLGVDGPQTGRGRKAKAALKEPSGAKAKVRVKRPVLTDEAVPGAPRGATPAKAGPGWITRGVHAGLRGVESGAEASRQLGVWGITAITAFVALCVLSGFAQARVPEDAPVRGMKMVYLDGPRLDDRDLFGLIRRYPGLDALRDGDDARLADFAAWLGEQPVIRTVAQVRCQHAVDGSRRVIEVELGLRSPELPVVLASGARAWIDAEGILLPSILPAPEGQPRPVLRGVEGVDRARIDEALWLWSQVRRNLEPGLITDIILDAPLGLLDQRGIVLGTRSGSQLIWGLPGDTRFGLDRERKVRDLVHSIRCQGDLSRIATINVRYPKAFFTLR